VHIYVNIDGDRPQYYPVALPQKPSTAEWQDKSDAWVKLNSPYSFQSNDAIRAHIQKIINLHKRLIDQGVAITHYHIRKELEFKGNRLIFNDYFKSYMRKPPEKVAITPITWEKYDAFIKHLDNFNPKIAFSQIDEDMVAKIRNFLAAQKGKKEKLLAPASVKSYFDKFAVVLRYAAKKDKLIDEKLVESFFEEVKISVPDREELLHLDIHEIKAIRKVPPDPQYPSQDRDRKLFLLQIYGTWYYNDLINLERQQVHIDHEVGMYVGGRRNKNGQPTIVPLWKFPNAVAIMREFEDPNPESKYWFQREIFVDVQVYNRNIKVIANKAGVHRKVSNKIARHTGWNLMIRMGVEWPVVKRIAGHKLEGIAGKHYVRIGLKEVIDGTKLAEFDKLGI
jgi:site-specific recombinase XerD